MLAGDLLPYAVLPAGVRAAVRVRAGHLALAAPRPRRVVPPRGEHDGEPVPGEGEGWGGEGWGGWWGE